jgi:hypothetical protein
MAFGAASVPTASMPGLFRSFRFSFRIAHPIAKLLAYIVPDGDASQLSTSVGQRPKTVCIHPGCLR